MKIKHKLRLNIYLTLFFVIVAGFVIWGGNREADRLGKLSLETSNIVKSVTELETLTHQYLLYVESSQKSVSETRQQDQWQHKYNSLIQQINSTSFVEKEEVRIYKQVQMNIGKLHNQYRKLQAEIKRMSKPDAHKEMTRERIQSLSDQILVSSQELVSYAFVLQNIVRDKTISSQKRINLYIFLLSLLLVLVIAVVNQFTATNVIRATDYLMKDIDYISNGNLDYQVAIRSKDEIGVLAATINRMTARLKNLITTRDALVKEIDERMKIDAALQESNQTLETILSSSPIGIAMIQNEAVRWANSGMKQIFQYDDDDPLTDIQLPTLFVSTSEYKRIQELKREMLAKNLPVETDAHCCRRDGSSFPGHLKISNIDQDSDVDRLIITLSDESWRKMAEAEKLMKEKLEVSLELAGAICHEMNQPLQYLSSAVELRLMSEATDKGSNTFEKIKSQVDRLGDITRKLQNITQYKTQDYVEGNKILDLDGSSNQEE